MAQVVKIQEKKIHSSFLFTMMPADVQALQGARASAAMVLT